MDYRLYAKYHRLYTIDYILLYMLVFIQFLVQGSYVLNVNYTSVIE